MQIYNTLTRRKEELIPVKEGQISMYVCGPTVYDYFHIGNARPFVVFDTLRRYLEYRGYKVKYVQNFTDIDDKMINRANREGITVKELGDRFIQEYYRDADALGIERATVNPRATEHIGDIIKLVKKLIEKGHAYATDNGDVYFSVRSDPGYGKLKGQDIDDMENGARISPTEQKRDPLDFALWKGEKPGEPSWPSPWGKGRPGWHIECSAMSMKYLGETFDIHGGGMDLIFPHHENEIAQSECAHDKTFANYWMHNAFLNIDNHKMSKSLGNFRTVRDVVTENDPQVVRFFMLSAHYRNPLNFSKDLLDLAKNSYDRIVNCASNLRFLMQGKDTADTTLAAGEEELLKEAEKFRTEFEKAMDDDFNTADAISAIFELVKWININASADNSGAYLGKLHAELAELSDVLGLIVDREEDLGGNEAKEIEALIEERQAARKARDFAKADAIRDSLKERGIILEDTKEGVKWHKA